MKVGKKRAFMKTIERGDYLNALIARRGNGQVKVITGIRRCGKSYLLKTIFQNWLLKDGDINPDDILSIELDDSTWLKCRNPLELEKTVKEWKLSRGKTAECIVFIDEIQLCEKVENPYLPQGKKITFYDALNGLLHLDGLDVYVTGSNSKMLSTDILTEFRGRGDEVHLHPLSFSEYFNAVGGDRRDALDRYLRFGGMPFTLARPNDASREQYLKDLFAEVYLKDIVERKHVSHVDVLSHVTDFLCSGIGSLTNPNNIANSLRTTYGYDVSRPTVASYIAHLKDAFLFSEARRYDVKGKCYFDYPNKYYCEDVGLRNARTDFRHQEMTHLMENIIYNELRRRGYSVDVGVVYSYAQSARGNSVRHPHEIDFVVNKGGERVYVQSAFAIPDGNNAKRVSEFKPFSLTGDSFRKIIIRQDVGLRFFDESGILNINLADFLLDPAVI